MSGGSPPSYNEALHSKYDITNYRNKTESNQANILFDHSRLLGNQPHARIVQSPLNSSQLEVSTHQLQVGLTQPLQLIYTASPTAFHSQLRQNVHRPPRQVIHTSPVQHFRLTRYPCSVRCNGCANHVTTKVRLEPGCYSCVLGSAIFVLGGAPCCLCLIPCCFDEFYDAVHYCSACGRKVGTSREHLF